MENEQVQKEDLPDIQNQEDKRNIGLDKVGISNRKVKAAIEMRNGNRQPIEMVIRPSVNLPKENKGIHMSRLLEAFYNDGRGINLDIGEIPVLNHVDLVTQAKEVLDTQDASSVELTAEFNYQLVKEAPASGKEAPVNYPVEFVVRTDNQGNVKKFIEVEVTGTSLCPCSKEISKYGAHNQRSVVTLRVETNNSYDGVVWIEDLIDVVENSFSEEIYALLKREDEKAVTEGAYENPKFVEDISRDVLKRLIKNYNEELNFATVKVENEESIHTHDAYAESSENLKKYRNGGEE